MTSHGFLTDIDWKADDGEDIRIASLTSKPPTKSESGNGSAMLSRIQSRPGDSRDLRADDGNLPSRFEWSVVLGGNDPFRQHIGYIIIREAKDLLVDILTVLTQTGRRPLELTRCF